MAKGQRWNLLAAVAVIAAFLTFELPHAGVTTYHPLVKQVDVPIMAKEAEAVLSGVVEKQLNSVRGLGPAGDDMVFTRWLIKPDRWYKGSTTKPIVVRAMGGQFGLTVVDVEDQPQYAVGERVMMFLKAQSGWDNEYRTVGEFQGKFHLETANGTVTARQSESGQSQPLTAIESAIRSSM